MKGIINKLLPLYVIYYPSYKDDLSSNYQLAVEQLNNSKKQLELAQEQLELAQEQAFKNYTEFGITLKNQNLNNLAKEYFKKALTLKYDEEIEKLMHECE